MSIEEVLLEAQRAHQLMTWALVFIVALDFLALCVVAGVLYLSRGGRAESQRIVEILREMREDSKRMQHYLFVKMGPADLK